MTINEIGETEANTLSTRGFCDSFYLGHPLKPIPLRENPVRTEKVATYVELELLRFYEEYAARCGFRSVSEAVRRLSIIGAMEEGYKVQGEG